MDVRIATVQFAPVYNDPLASMAKAESIIEERLYGKSVDIMMFPEMAFTGYQFRNRESILHLCEIADKGITYDFAKRISRKYNCGVFVGFPRRDGEGNDVVLYNSMLCVDPNGEIVTVYDKKHLFVTDKSWSSEGGEFQTITLSWLGDLKVCLGICMDLNPYEFEAPFELCELASYCAEEDAKLLLFSSAWCNRNPDDPPDAPIEDPNSIETINYWAARLRPLIGKKVHFIAADRVGVEPAALFRESLEGDVTFCGCSCVLSMKEPAIVSCLNTTEEDVLVTKITIRA